MKIQPRFFGIYLCGLTALAYIWHAAKFPHAWRVGWAKEFSSTGSADRHGKEEKELVPACE
jgi:hypothetical protein